MNTAENNNAVLLRISEQCYDTPQAVRLREKFTEGDGGGLVLNLDSDGLSLVSSDGLTLRGDFSHLQRRVSSANINSELLVRAAKIKNHNGPLTAIDATAGMGDDSFLLAAAGFNVKMYERNPVIYELLYDSLLRAREIPGLRETVLRMEVHNEDSISAMRNINEHIDVVLLDPMFPERQKSSLVKKKLQLIQSLENPCDDENELFLAAVGVKPKKLVIKRPPKGGYLAGIKPDHSLSGKAVRYDCFVEPFNRMEKFRLQ
ncbi:MAG: SAM-dependent methyltransferase [Anaerofustis stercorihominis]|nr:SAM-dependent methyltransferase [Anaerofustis stercorihominis]